MKYIAPQLNAIDLKNSFGLNVIKTPEEQLIEDMGKVVVNERP